jgi:penicillin amidase
MVRMQADVRSLSARELLPLMLPAAQALPAPTPIAREAIKLLEDWTAIVDDDLPQPLIFNAWLREFNRALFADELGDDFRRISWSLRPRFIAHVLNDNPRWCDDIATPSTETCETQLQIAFTAALESLAASYGPVPQRWRWGKVHRVHFSHRVLNRIPLLGPLMDVELPTPGDDSTVNRGTTSIGNEAAPFAHVHGPSLRAIYDLTDLANSRFILAGGQSGNRLSPLYANMAERWRDVEYITMPAQTADAHRLLLNPAGFGR